MAKSIDAQSLHFKAIFYAVVAYLIAFWSRKNWYLRGKIKREEYNVFANYTLKEVPVTYYDANNINDVIDSWYKETASPDGNYFHLFRVKNGQKKVFDYKQLNSYTQAMELKRTCDIPESIICSPCFDHESQKSVHTNDIFGSSNSNYYSSFAKLDDIPSVAALFNFVNISGF